MILDITNTKLQEVNFFPETELEEIAQNVKTILTTLKGEVFLDRDFGVASEILDAPINSVRARLTAKIADAVNKFEPRAKVTDCFFGGQKENGEVEITVRIRIVEKFLRSQNGF